MKGLVPVAAAEWLKLRSVRSTWWFLGGALVAMLLLASLEASDLRVQSNPPGSVEAGSVVVTAVGWLHFVLGSLGMLAITSEYATRSIVVTLACTPSRGGLLLAKAAVVGAVVFAAGLLAAALGVAAGAGVLGEHGYVDAASTTGRILAIAIDLALVAVLALGLGALVRRSAGTLAVLLGLLLVLPAALGHVADTLDAAFLATIANHMPTAAGERFVTGEPVFGLVLAGWAACAVVVGVCALRARDA